MALASESFISISSVCLQKSFSLEVEKPGISRTDVETFSEKSKVMVPYFYEVCRENTLFGITNSTQRSPCKCHMYIELSPFNRSDL